MYFVQQYTSQKTFLVSTPAFKNICKNQQKIFATEYVNRKLQLKFSRVIWQVVKKYRIMTIYSYKLLLLVEILQRIEKII